VASILGVCASLGVVDQGTDLHAHIAKTEFQSDVFVGCDLVTMYAKYGIVDYACKVFDEMATASLTLWNSMIAACVQNELDLQALELFYEMCHLSLRLDIFKFVGVLRACENLGVLE
jgi:pentatricopeptide repeat protein